MAAAERDNGRQEIDQHGDDQHGVSSPLAKSPAPRQLAMLASGINTFWKGEIFMTQDAFSSLQEFGDQLRVQLSELPEYRALVVIDRTLLELSQILNPPATTSSSLAGLSSTAREASNGAYATLRGAPQRAETPTPAGETIAARAASFSALAGTRPSAVAR
jgi:hypothetical protein